MAKTLGLNAKLFHGVAGTTAAQELKSVKDVKLNLSTGTADITTRASEGWRTKIPTLKEASVSFDMLWDSEDAGFTALQTAFFGGTAIALFVSDGSGNGLDADFTVTEFARDESLEEAIVVHVTCEPTMDTRAPAWKTAGA